MIADLRLFRSGALVGSRPTPPTWCFVLGGGLARGGSAPLRRALDRATRLTSADRVVAGGSRRPPGAARAPAPTAGRPPHVPPRSPRRGPPPPPPPPPAPP